ncbi:hypothetical protein PP175_25840 (plasmid) [Aneurinibacillus sp. Ricciae_BoGa-3]|uniref:hypothetical protein n=1 Tax=Aneurinibacillus sp. Ricciae_BoGa-3 TaxID=3022697 RepID=UPI002342134A|nr:hypothetical protein [Aneurinibacillus sp. Ricciae_BoGa-3]WCK57491.1 hypothetical protein PP175_25840 [Aneurinibacillus sp. Ricciae_BoGa-3]
MDKSKYGVHERHCCVRHGCKYGDKDCPVINELTKQDNICEECSDEGIKTVDELVTKKDIETLRNILEHYQEMTGLNVKNLSHKIIKTLEGSYYY